VKNQFLRKLIVIICHYPPSDHITYVWNILHFKIANKENFGGGRVIVGTIIMYNIAKLIIFEQVVVIYFFNLFSEINFCEYTYYPLKIYKKKYLKNVIKKNAVNVADR